MLAGLLLLPFFQLKVGGYPMPELCRLLSVATGTPHVADQTLQDYPVFVSVKSGDPLKVRKLVAAALHAEWRDDGKSYRLAPTKLGSNEGIEEFERQYKAAIKGHKYWMEIPILDLYRLAPGETIRYGPKPSQYVHALPPKLVTKLKNHEVEGDTFSGRRMTSGVFEFGQGQIEFTLLPEAVEKALGDDLTKNALTKEDREKLQNRMGDPGKLKLDLSDFSKHDPVADIASWVLAPAAEKTSKDLVAVIPDFSFFPVMGAANGPGTIQSILAQFSQVLDWKVVDDSIVGCLSPCEVKNLSQSRRSVLGKFVAALGKSFVNIDTFGAYVASQRPAASNSWCDAMLLVMSGVLVDEEYIGDYPYNVRLYSKLNGNDWALLRSGQPFQASSFSAPVKSALQELLLQSRNAQMGDHADPGFWPTIAPQDLVVSAKIVDEPVLIGWIRFPPEVGSVRQLASSYEWMRPRLESEPLFQPGTRRKLEMKVTLLRRAVDGSVEEVTTGFSDVIPDPKAKPCVWTSLPESTVKEFREAYEEAQKNRQNRGGDGDPPPPLNRL